MTKIINVTDMINNLSLNQLTELGVDKRELFLKIFEVAVHAQNQPNRKLTYDEIYKTLDEYPQWCPLELTDLLEYLLNYIIRFKNEHYIPKGIKLKLVTLMNNRVTCFVKLEMCAKTTSEMYQAEMIDYQEELEAVLEDEAFDVIENPTAEDLERMNV